MQPAFDIPHLGAVVVDAGRAIRSMPLTIDPPLLTAVGVDTGRSVFSMPLAVDPPLLRAVLPLNCGAILSM
jgi:hypothetical protein